MAFTVYPQLTPWWPGSVIAAAGLGLSAFAPNVIFLYFSAGVLIGPLLFIKLICSFYSTLSFLGSNNCISFVCLSPTAHLTSSHCWLYRRWKDQHSVNTLSWWFFFVGHGFGIIYFIIISYLYYYYSFCRSWPGHHLLAKTGLHHSVLWQEEALGHR